MLRVPVAEIDLVDLPAALKRLDAKGIATAMDGTPYTELTLDSDASVAIILGSEAHGLGEQVRRFADHTVSIPMHGKVESLNVATTGAVLAFDIGARHR